MIIQVFHAILYITLVSTAFELAIESLLGVALAIALLSAMEKFGNLLRQLFNLTGGSGSLFEEMASRANFQSMKSAITNLPNTIVGGTMGKNALKLSTRIATKPVRKAAETGFGKVMEMTANSKKYKDWKNSRDKKNEKKVMDEYNEFINSPEYANEKATLDHREEELYNKREKLQKEKDDLKRQLDRAKNTGDQAKIDDLTRKLAANEEEQQQNNKDIIENQRAIDDFESGVQRGFVDYYFRSRSSWDVIKQNFGNLFDPENYVDKEVVTADDIEKKTSEMFSDYDKYYEIIKNGGRSKEDAELYEKYTEMKKMIDKRKSLSDQVRDLTKQSLTNPNQYSEALEQAKTSLQQVEDDMRNKYSEYFPNESHVNQNSVTELFDKAEKKVKDMKKKLSDGGEEKQKRQKDAVEEANQKLKKMREQAKEALTKYKVKKTKREGNSKYAFWRKKESGVGKIFLDNAKIDKILGISGEEKKKLKEQFKEAKQTVIGAFSGIAGFGLLGSNPAIGMPLLVNAMNTRMESFFNMKQVKNVPSRLKYKYKFRRFGEGSQKVINDQMGREIRVAESKLTRFNIQRHPVLKKIVSATDNFVISPIVRGTLTFSGITLGTHFSDRGMFDRTQQPYSDIPESHYKRKIITSDAFYSDKLDDIYQKRVRKAIKEAQKELIEENTKTFEEEYKSESKKYKQKIRDDVKNKSTGDLIMEEAFSSDDVMQVDDDTIIEYVDPSMPKVDFGNANSTFSNDLREQRIDQIKTLIENDKQTLIQMAIFNLSMSKKVTDISSLSIDDRDIMAIRRDIKDRFERKGHLRKGELKINGVITENDIKETLNKLKRSNGGSSTSQGGSANDRLANIMVKKACMTYMVQSGITDPKQLSSQQARSQIETMIANELISKASRAAIMQIGGQPRMINSNLPSSFSNIADRIDTVSQNIKVKSVKQVRSEIGKKHSRRELADRSIIRRENEMKSNLESAMYTGDDSSVDDEAQLRMLFLLSEIGNQNRISQKVNGKKTKKTKEETLSELRYEQYIARPGDGYLQGDDSQTQTSREEDLNVLLHGRKDIIDIINNF